MTDQFHPADASARRPVVPSAVAGATYIHWSPIVAGAFGASALSFVLLSFGTGIGLAVASPSASWRDTSATLAVIAGLWLLLTAIASFALGGYLAGRLRPPSGEASPEEVEFVDGVHGLVVWGLSIVLAALLAFATTKAAPTSAALTTPTASNAESLLASELDRLFRSDSRPVDPANDNELRAQAARIITAGLGRSGMSGDDRTHLIRLVEARTGLPQPGAEARVDQAISQSADAIRRAGHAAVILAFMIAASLLIGAAVAWLMAALGGQHRDGASAPHFWRRWEVDRFFMVR
ncbi:MAG TPA: hypothetical protein VKW08_27160 [Xanthobacteraceae bacterium]|nr:hypothetical protein [Xanthobacteraceae bacterium]